MMYAVYLGLFAPLVGFLILLAGSNYLSRKQVGFIGCISVLISFISFAYTLLTYTAPVTFTLYPWIHLAGINADVAFHIDPLSIVMTLIISGIGFLIHVYSNGYMDHDEDIARYFACMNFFIFSMLTLVLAANLLLLFVGWEGVGLASYLLIGYYYQKPSAAQAATKAFVVNRIGDWGLLLGILLTFLLFGTTDILAVSKEAQKFAVGAPIIAMLTALYFIGATGKSAQIPLQTWLPDAMEGPTPVSALIHAATMVTAGVYVVVRMHEVFMLAPVTLYIVGVIGGVTALYAALSAIGQSDLKRVLAYSTISQLGYMFLACGVGAFYAAMFHLTTHAFVKALLFLSAGDVVHMLHGETEMGAMGGLAKKFPKTHWVFLIGVLALSGIPPLSAFFSKELILEQEHLAGHDILYAVGLITSALTAFYLTRAYSLTFMGKPRMEISAYEQIKEAPSIMTIPVFALAILAVVGGVVGLFLGGFLAEVGITLSHHEEGNYLFTLETLFAVLLAILGVALGVIVYTRYYDRFGLKTWPLLSKAFYINEIYDRVVVYPLKALVRTIKMYTEPYFFEGSIYGAVHGAGQIAARLQNVQSGQIRSYVAWMIVGVIFLIVYMGF